MTYWERRWAADAARAHREADALAADIARLHMRAAARIQAMAGRIRQRFRAAYALSEEDAAALLAAPAGREMYLELLAEIERLGPKNPMRDALLAKAAAPGYAYRIGVAEAMLQELDAVTAHLAQQEETLIRAHLTQTLQDKANRAGYLIQLEAGVGFRFHPISGELAREMLRRPWSGMEFSGRIWRNREALAGLLNTVLLEGLTAGNSAQAMAQEITESMNVSIQRAKTLVRTETTYVCNQADLHAYAEAEITAYRYCATLDMRTSRACRALDGKEFETAEAVVGSNYPPMHPNCRSVTRPAIGQEELARMERWARDPVTGKGVKVPADMTYAQWRGMQAETYGETLEERAKGAAPDRKGAEGDKKKRLKVAKTVEKPEKSGMISSVEMYRKKSTNRGGDKFVTDTQFNNLTIAARKNGAVILRGSDEIEKHLDEMDAAASTIGDAILFRKDVLISEVIEETHHFMQNVEKMNDDKGEPLRTILNEIDAKQFILDHAREYKVPRSEIELTQKQLESYKKQLQQYQKGGEG